MRRKSGISKFKAGRSFQVFAKPLSGRCNLACRYCYYLGIETRLAGEEPARMSGEMLERYIRQHIEAWPDETVRFSWHGGEPTLLGLDYFRHVIALQRKLCCPGTRIVNGIQTNGTLIDDEWACFLADNGFSVGLSLDGPQELHDAYRIEKTGEGSYARVLRGFEALFRRGVAIDILCVVNDCNVMYPLQVYNLFKKIGAKHLTFLPLVELERRHPLPVVSSRSVTPEGFGAFLCTIFDEWVNHDIGAIQVQIFEEATRTAFNQKHSLCLFRPVCGDIPVLEANGDFYACDHFVASPYRIGNIGERPLKELLDDRKLRSFGLDKRRTLPRQCLECEVLAMCAGECPKNRFVPVAGERFDLNYLCAGYKMFFTHCRPFVEAVKRQWQADRARRVQARTGRNETCPCGSGKKFKECCLRR